MTQLILLYPSWQLTAIYWVFALLAACSLFLCLLTANSLLQQSILLLVSFYLIYTSWLHRHLTAYQVIALRLSRYDRFDAQIELMIVDSDRYLPSKFFAKPLVHHLLTILPLQTADLQRYYLVICNFNAGKEEFRRLRLFLQTNSHWQLM